MGAEAVGARASLGTRTHTWGQDLHNPSGACQGAHLDADLPRALVPHQPQAIPMGQATAGPAVTHAVTSLGSPMCKRRTEAGSFDKHLAAGSAASSGGGSLRPQGWSSGAPCGLDAALHPGTCPGVAGLPTPWALGVQRPEDLPTEGLPGDSRQAVGRKLPWR